MDKSFKPTIMATYAELCVSWRMAHVANLVQAADLNARLVSLEAVIKAFDFGSPTPQGAEGSRPTPAKANDPASTFRKAPVAAKSGGMILED